VKTNIHLIGERNNNKKYVNSICLFPDNTYTIRQFYLFYFYKYLGLQFNEETIYGDWWSNETVAKFQERQQCLVNQYNKYFYTEGGGYVSKKMDIVTVCECK
jgi:hypothetical protein